MPSPLSPIHSLGDALDNLGIALCAFDARDRTTGWNRTFLRLFPEHEGQMHVGEHYEAQCRRVNAAHQDTWKAPCAAGGPDERPATQALPCSLERHGNRLRASSMPIADGGWAQLWQIEAPQSSPGPARDSGSLDPLPANLPDLIDCIPDGVMVCGADQRIRWVNEHFMQMYGVTERAAVLGRAFDEVYCAAWRAQTTGLPQSLTGSRDSLCESMRVVGTPFELPLPGQRWSRVIARQSPGGMVFCTHVDITEFKRQRQLLEQAERNARDSEARLREKSLMLEAMLETMDQGISKISATGVVELCNRRAMEMLDLPEELIASRPQVRDLAAFLQARGEFDLGSPLVQSVIANLDDLTQLPVYERVRPDGRIFEFLTVPFPGGGVLRTYTDITERRRAEQRIRYLAEHDGLTGLLNRSAFRESLQTAVDDLALYGRGFAVVYLDLDGFKPVNDRHGHAVGDQLLAQVAERLTQVAREGDIVARLGGDEFALLLHGVSEVDAAQRLGLRLVQAISEPAMLESHAVQVAASVGIALSPPQGADAEALLRQADAAMFRAKADGRGCVRMHGCHAVD